MGFGRDQQIAISLAGTVALPSPFPRHGRASAVVLRNKEGEAERYIKLVHNVGPKQIVTRFIRACDLRAVRKPADDCANGFAENWPVTLVEAIEQELDKAFAGAEADAPGPEGAAEADLFPAVIVYVPEAAPVLHRIEFGVTAGISAESISFAESLWPGGCCVSGDPGNAS